MRWLLALLACGALGFRGARADGACFWVDTLQWCQGTNDGPHGEEWAYRGALRVRCVTSNDDAGGKRIGCAAGTDSTLCKNQTYHRHEEGEAACEPLISAFPDSSVFPLVCVTGIRTPECDQSARESAIGMGCPECAEASIEGGEIQPICKEAQTEAECRAANPGGDATFGSGSMPAELLNAGAESAGSVSGSRLAACMSSMSVLLVAVVVVVVVVVVAGIAGELSE